MIRKIAVYFFAAALVTVFGVSASFAEGDKDKARQDRSTMSQDRSEDMKGKEVSLDLAPAPKVSTQAKGETEFKFEDDGKTLTYKIEVDNIKDVTQAHVHMVKPDGSAGEVIAPLFPVRGTGALPSSSTKRPQSREGDVKEGEFSGTLTEGRLSSEHLTGSMKGKSTQDLYEMLRTGKAGVNVHTKANPVGEIWGAAKAD